MTATQSAVSDSFEIHVIPAAHETFKVNDRGEHHFLGFILKLGGLTLYHSGDCVVYDGLVERLREWRIDLALLPVNGRSERLTARGVPGNMTFEEARDLCLAARIGAMIPHHFGMFEFNTIDPRELQAADHPLGRDGSPVCVARCGSSLRINMNDYDGRGYLSWSFLREFRGDVHNGALNLAVVFPSACHSVRAGQPG